jgi:hypothetical protein
LCPRAVEVAQVIQHQAHLRLHQRTPTILLVSATVPLATLTSMRYWS